MKDEWVLENEVKKQFYVKVKDFGVIGAIGAGTGPPTQHWRALVSLRGALIPKTKIKALGEPLKNSMSHSSAFLDYSKPHWTPVTLLEPWKVFPWTHIKP